LKIFKIKDTQLSGFLKIISEQNDRQFPDFEILQTTGEELAFQCRFFDQFFNLFSSNCSSYQNGFFDFFWTTPRQGSIIPTLTSMSSL
jgi:hypothetical protein